MYTTFTKTDRGLRIELTDAGRVELRDQNRRQAILDDGNQYMFMDIRAKYRKSSLDIFIELIDDHLCNGWDIISAEDIGALTSNPYMISDTASRNDQGDLEWTDSVYYFDAYQIRDPLVDLEQNGCVLFNVEHSGE